MRTVGLFILLVALFAAPVLAQDGTCAPDLSTVTAALEQAQQAIGDADSAAVLDALGEARAALATAEGQCLDFAPETAGDSRTNPVPFGQLQHISHDDYDGSIQVLDFLADAEELIMSISSSNDAAPEGKRYVAMAFKFICERPASESCEYSRVDFSLVGDKGVAYDYDAGDIGGLENKAEFFGGAEITVGVAFLVDADDDNFVLYTEYARPRTYFAAQPPE